MSEKISGEEILHKAGDGIKKRLKVDILSDVHFDNYFYGKYSKDDVINFYSQIIDFNNCGDVYTKIFILTY